METSFPKSQSPEKLTDQAAEKLIEQLGKTKPVQIIRNSQVISAMIGAAGLALFLVGVEKVFSNLSGWVSITLGVIFLIVSGTLLTKLGR